LVQRHRPQALLRARRLLVACLAAAGRADEAKAVLVIVASQCAQIGSFRYLPDGGPHVAATLAALHQDQQNGRWRPEWPEVPADFLVSLVDAKVVHTI
jgi:serine/threonine-protein kinase PknK